MREVSTQQWEFDIGGIVITIYSEAVAKELDRLQRAEAERDSLASELKQALLRVVELDIERNRLVATVQGIIDAGGFPLATVQLLVELARAGMEKK